MSLTDVIILLFVVGTLGLIIYFSFIKPKIKHTNVCSKCAYAKNCSKKDKQSCNDQK